MTFKEILIKFRAKHCLTQGELAEILNVSPCMICRYENQKSKPTIMHRIAFENKMKEWEGNKNAKM